MDNKIITGHLRELATNNETRSMASRLRDIIDDVEAALAAGVSQALVIKTLNDYGIKFTINGFNSTLQRIRKKRGSISSNSAKTTKTTLEIEDIADKNSTVSKSHNPTDLDKIIGNNPNLSALAKLAKKKGK